MDLSDIVLRSQELGTFDFIYAAGLYDYLNDKVAIKLTKRCMEMLAGRDVPVRQFLRGYCC